MHLYWLRPCIRGKGGRVSNDEMWRETSEGEGACLPVFADRSHLPLRGKLGWMTPRSGVKTTLEMRCTFRGSRSQAGAPFFWRFFVSQSRGQDRLNGNWWSGSGRAGCSRWVLVRAQAEAYATRGAVPFSLSCELS